MGQYYKGVIFTKSSRKQKNNKIKVCLDNWAYKNGAKLMEHSYVGNSYVRAYEYLLAERYDGYPFVWIGDYADEHNGENVYDLAYNYREQQSDRMAKKQGFKKENGYYYKYDRDGYCIEKKSSFYEEISCDEKVTYEYILNYDKKCFVRIPKMSNEKDAYGYPKLTIHPLPLLCADGNQRGGGDYYGSNEELVGLWAYDRIGVSNEIPSDFKTELIVTFKEKYEGGEGNDYEYRSL